MVRQVNCTCDSYNICRSETNIFERASSMFATEVNSINIKILRGLKKKIFVDYSLVDQANKLHILFC